MNSLPFEVILQIAGITSLVTIALSSAAVWMFKSSIGVYLGEKATNLATKQDVAEITRRQEQEKLVFDEIRESLRSESQMRIAVVERRFQAHQEAFSLWMELRRSAKRETCQEVVQKCADWWNSNSLYLEAEPRAAFRLAYMSAGDHLTFLKLGRDPENTKAIKANWKMIMDAGPIIEAAVQLPPLVTQEAELPDDDELSGLTPHTPA